MTRNQDIDEATLALYHEVRNSPQHGPFIRHIEAGCPPTAMMPKPRVVIMPGAFYREYPHTGADGQRVFDLASTIGWPAERVEVPSLATMASNSAALVERLLRLGEAPIVLVSLSKGGADVCAALHRADADTAFRNVRCWINLSGIVTGTPLVAWLKSRPLRCFGVRVLLRLRRQRFACLEELRCGQRSPLDRPLKLPLSMRAIHVVGFPLVQDLSSDWARRGHARIAEHGPNDGGGILLRNIIGLPGVMYPVLGADHYLNPPRDIRPLLLQILQAAGRPPTSIVTSYG
jgi:hypothetical protein